MAVTKTHPIKSTLKAAIDYICNPEKTDGKLLVSSYGCAAETADIEFSWTRRHAIDKGTNLGRHLIQAFQPGEVTPEQAHEIGMELAKEILGGKYEFVLTTHIDKDHVHVPAVLDFPGKEGKLVEQPVEMHFLVNVGLVGLFLNDIQLFLFHFMLLSEFWA